MPPLAIASLFHRVLPWLSQDGRAVVSTLICENGRVGSAEALSARLGLRNRYQLARLLQREGLPPYEELAGWVCVLYWMLRADAGEARGALRSLVGKAGIDTASSYRLVRRVTGQRWKDLRRFGTDALVRRFQARLRPPLSRLHADVRAVRDPGRWLAPPYGAAEWSDTDCCRLPLPGKPYGVAVRAHEMAYITRGNAAAVERLDLRTGQFTDSVRVGCTPTSVVFAPTAARAFVSVQFCDEIAVIDTTRHAVIQSIPLAGNPFPLLLSDSGRTLFVTTNEDRLFAISMQSGRVIGTLALPATSHHLALHPAGDRLYVATRAAGSVLEVDIPRFRVLRAFSLGGWPQGLVVTPDGTTLFAANEHHGLDVVRIATGKRVAMLDSETGAVALALSPDRRFLYTGLVHAGKVGVVDVASLRSRGTMKIGGRPAQIAFDGNGRVIVSNEHGWVDILPLGRPQVRTLAHPPVARGRVAVSIS